MLVLKAQDEYIFRILLMLCFKKFFYETFILMPEVINNFTALKIVLH